MTSRLDMKSAFAVLPTKYGVFKIFIYQTKEGDEHIALLKEGDFKKAALVRIHSECLTGEVFSSLRCDCGDQLAASLTKIGKAENGLLIYLKQEGRGIGLANKIKAYILQETGLDTVEANKKLGFTADSRSYQAAAQILKELEINKIILLTNNPNKVNQLRKLGIDVIKRQSLEIPPNPANKAYLKAKKNKLGHKLKLV